MKGLINSVDATFEQDLCKIRPLQLKILFVVLFCITFGSRF